MQAAAAQSISLLHLGSLSSNVSLDSHLVFPYLNMLIENTDNTLRFRSNKLAQLLRTVPDTC